MVHLEDVDLACSSGGLGDFRYGLAEEGVEHAALADVGPPEKGHLRQVRLGFRSTLRLRLTLMLCSGYSYNNRMDY